MKFLRGDLVSVIGTEEVGIVVSYSSPKWYSVKQKREYSVEIDGEYYRYNQDDLRLVQSYQDQVIESIERVISKIRFGGSVGADVLDKLREFGVISKGELERY